MCKRADFPVFPFTSISNPSLSHNYIDKTEKKKKIVRKSKQPKKVKLVWRQTHSAAHRKGVVREGRRAACSDALARRRKKGRAENNKSLLRRRRMSVCAVLCKSHKCVKGREADQSHGGLAA